MAVTKRKIKNAVTDDHHGAFYYIPDSGDAKSVVETNVLPLTARALAEKHTQATTF